MAIIGCPAGQRLFTTDGWIMRTYCNSWHCPVCRRRLAHYWAEQVYYGWCLWRPRPFYFLTFTLPGWLKVPASGYDCLPGCWDTLRKEIQRTYGWFIYAAFVEEQTLNRNMPHLHVLTLTNLPSRLNEIALHAGFGYQSQNLLVTGRAAVYYVAKYASKELAHAPKNFRRVRISQTWPRLPSPDLPQDYIPQPRTLSTSEYIWMCSAQLGIEHQVLVERYDNHALDLE